MWMAAMLQQQFISHLLTKLVKNNWKKTSGVSYFEERGFQICEHVSLLNTELKNIYFLLQIAVPLCNISFVIPGICSKLLKLDKEDTFMILNVAYYRNISYGRGKSEVICCLNNESKRQVEEGAYFAGTTNGCEVAVSCSFSKVIGYRLNFAVHWWLFASHVL